MAVDLHRLLTVMEGSTTPKNGVAGVAGVAPVALLRPKSPALRQLRLLRVKNTELEKDGFGGVAEGVAAALRHPLDGSERPSPTPPSPLNDDAPAPEAGGNVRDKEQARSLAHVEPRVPDDDPMWQRVANERNAAEKRRGTTARYCRCQKLASMAWAVNNREVWTCEAHSPPDGFDPRASRKRCISGLTTPSIWSLRR